LNTVFFYDRQRALTNELVIENEKLKKGRNRARIRSAQVTKVGIAYRSDVISAQYLVHI